MRGRAGQAERRGGARGERGSGSVEYIGVMLIVAVVVAAIALAFSNESLTSETEQAVCAVFQGDCDGSTGDDQASGPDGSTTNPDDPSGTGSGPDGSSTTDPGGTQPGGTQPGTQPGGTGSGSGSSDDCGFWCTVGRGASAVGGGVWNGIKGVGSAAWDDVTGIVDIVKDPGLLIDAAKAIWDDPVGVLGKVLIDQESRDAWAKGDYGTAIGRSVWNIGSLVIPVTKAGKAGKAGKVGKIASEAGKLSSWVSDARKAATAAKEAAKAGDPAKAARAAAEARRLADEAAENARKAGCPIAAPLFFGGGGGRMLGTSAPSVGVLPREDGCKAATDASREADKAADEAEAAAKAKQWPEDPAPGTPEYDLGYDPAVKKFRKAEYKTATRIIDERGVQLTRAPEGAPYDWVDNAGRTYDAVGGFPGKYLDAQWGNFTKQIDAHVNKADYVPVDVSGFTPAQIARVEAYIAGKGPQVFIVGKP